MPQPKRAPRDVMSASEQRDLNSTRSAAPAEPEAGESSSAASELRTGFESRRRPADVDQTDFVRLSTRVKPSVKIALELARVELRETQAEIVEKAIIAYLRGKGISFRGDTLGGSGSL